MLGVVMAGGLSTRLGQDKVRLSVHGEGMPDMLQRTVALLEQCTNAVCVSARASRDVTPYTLIADETEGQGPFGGIYSVLRRTGQPLLVLSCDLPFIDEATVQRLLAARAARQRGAIMTTFQQQETGFIEALVAVYEPECLPFFAAAQEQGIRKLSRVVPPHLREHIPYGQEEALPFFNINYPEDFALACRMAAQLPCLEI
ncbi:MAG: molybdenum cofactor guanylyltransferase [Desulfovibrionaceae bacterium]|nr:molybdenum cofactor guanylyltransferase [Desulfovibrionaceae bacterium]